MKKTLAVNATLVAGILAASAIGTVHAGQQSAIPAYQAGYRAGAAAMLRQVKTSWGTGICGTALTGTAVEVWHFGFQNRQACRHDRDSGLAAITGEVGTVEGQTACWWIDNKELTLVMDSGTMQDGIDYCNITEPK